MKISKSNILFVLLALTTIAVVIGYCLNHSSNENKAESNTTIAESGSSESQLIQGVEAPNIYEQLTKHEFLDSLVSYLPDHSSIGPATAFTQEYYDTWQEAWEIPGGGLGGIGNDEILYHFVCGNDPCPKHTGKLDRIAVSDTVLMRFDIVHQTTPQYTPHTLKLVYEDDRWLIADFDSTLSLMKNYIVELRKYLSSKEFETEANEILSNPTIDQKWRDAVTRELQAAAQYFEKHPGNEILSRVVQCDTSYYVHLEDESSEALTIIRQGYTFSCYFHGCTDLFDPVREGFYPGYMVLKADSFEMAEGKISGTLNSTGCTFVNKPIDLDIYSMDNLPEGYNEWLQSSKYFWNKEQFSGTEDWSTNDITLTINGATKEYKRKSYEEARKCYNSNLLSKEEAIKNSKQQ